MRIIQVDKQKIIETLKVNRDIHVADFEDQMEGWKQRVQERCNAIISSVQKGEEAELHFDYLDKPFCREDDYDIIIGMFEMDETTGSVELTETDYRKYILDSWDWEQSFSSNKMRYSASK